MKNIKHIFTWVLLLCIFNSCGLDKLNDHTECNFYLKNETGSTVVFTLQYYASETSQLPTQIVKTINDGECVELMGGLQVGDGFSFTDEELFEMTLIGDPRDDSYAEVQISDNEEKIRWDPNEIDENSFYSQGNWLFEETEKNGKVYKKWTYLLNM